MSPITYTKKMFWVFSVLCILSACKETKEFSISEEKDRILELHHLARDYHFGKDSVAFAHQLSSDFISVNKGEITTPNMEEIISRYHRYFSSVEFVKWDDVAEPIIKFSDDGSMAYVIVDKIVVVTYKDENGNSKEGQTHFAWTAIYKKYGSEWKIDCVTSTERSSE